MHQGTKSYDRSIATARARFTSVSEEAGLDPIAEEVASLSVGSEFLPPFAAAVLEDRTAETVAYWDWLCTQVSK